MDGEDKDVGGPAPVKRSFGSLENSNASVDEKLDQPVFETPTSAQIEQDFERALATTKPGLPLELSVPESPSDEEPPESPEALETPSARDIEQKFEDLLNDPNMIATDTISEEIQIGPHSPSPTDREPSVSHPSQDATADEPSSSSLHNTTGVEIEQDLTTPVSPEIADDTETGAPVRPALPSDVGGSPSALSTTADESSVEGTNQAELETDDTCPAWRRRKKHIFVLSSAGKPVYSRYGDENALAGFMAILQAMISFVQDSGDTLHSLRAGCHQVVFLVRGPLYLVAVAATGEPVSVLHSQLDLLYGQLLAILTNAVERAFQRSPKFDMRQLLGGTEPVFKSIIRSFTWDPAVLLGAVTPLPLSLQARQAATQALQAAYSPSLQFAMLLIGNQVITLLSARRSPMHPSDLLLLANFVRSSEAFRLSESFAPVCLPHFNPAMFLYAYIAYLESEVCLLMLSSKNDSFYDLAEARRTIESTLHRSRVIAAAKEAHVNSLLQMERLPVYAGGGAVGLTPLWHFLYHNLSISQVAAPAFRAPLHTKAAQKTLLRAYQRLYAAAHGDKDRDAHASRVHFRGGDHHVLVAVLGVDFELYAAFDPLTDKPSAVSICNRLCSWVRTEDDILFITPFPIAFEQT